MNSFPKTVDLDVNWICNLDCPWCWWPEHEAAIDTMSIDDWKRVIEVLYRDWVRNIVFSGWEPLLKKGLINLIKFAKEIWMQTTLSTNGILLPNNKNILEYVDQLGLPLDWSSHSKNKLMRISKTNFNHFESAINAIKLVQDEYSKIELTVRSVVTSVSIFDVPNILQSLKNNGINIYKIRWKIYQCATSWPRYNDIIKQWFLVSIERYRELLLNVRKRYPEVNIGDLSIEWHSWRYVHILPNWDARILTENELGHPRDVVIWNVKKSWEEIKENLDSQTFLWNTVHWV